MKVISHILGDHKEIVILPLADLHLGDIHSDYKKIVEWLDYVLSVSANITRTDMERWFVIPFTVFTDQAAAEPKARR